MQPMLICLSVDRLERAAPGLGAEPRAHFTARSGRCTQVQNPHSRRVPKDLQRYPAERGGPAVALCFLGLPVLHLCISRLRPAAAETELLPESTDAPRRSQRRATRIPHNKYLTDSKHASVVSLHPFTLFPPSVQSFPSLTPCPCVQCRPIARPPSGTRLAESACARQPIVRLRITRARLG